MKKYLAIAFVILGTSSMAQAATWWLNCVIQETTTSHTEEYSIESRSSIGAQASRLTSGLAFEAYMEVKRTANPMTPWIKIGDRQVIINVLHNGVNLSHIVSKDDALSLTYMNGKRLMIACHIFKK